MHGNFQYKILSSIPVYFAANDSFKTLLSWSGNLVMLLSWETHPLLFHYSSLSCKHLFSRCQSKCPVSGSMRHPAMPVCPGLKSTHFGGVWLLVAQDSKRCDPESCCLWKLPRLWTSVALLFRLEAKRNCNG